MRYGLLGKKIGMTRVYDEKGRVTPVTVVAVGGNTLLQVKTLEKDGYSAVQVGFDTQKPQRLPKAQLGHFKKAGSEPKRLVREFRLSAQDKVEGDLNLGASHFQQGQLVDVIGRSKGLGFQGIMVKHNARGQGETHGSMTHRRPGSIGNRSTPGRVWKNKGMPGHDGDDRITVQNLEIVQVREEEQVLLIKGAIPGSNGGYVVVRPAKKSPLPSEAK
ncbi:MAG TPA: 50S ribosomal protein L3 [Chthoniobacteraceae bacterium]|nr:50S ribosomal protein L3 [Chthoniobacteraceae bacterium]